jgi:hypothetical protein
VTLRILSERQTLAFVSHYSFQLLVILWHYEGRSNCESFHPRASLHQPHLWLAYGRDDVDLDVQLHTVQIQNCPIACEYVTSDTSTWTTYHSFKELEFCDNTVLFTFNIQSGDVNPHIKACLTSTSGPQMQAGAYYSLLQNTVTCEQTPEMVPKLVMYKGKKVKLRDGSCGASPQDTTMAVKTR